jgi:hypothetical protein
VLFLGEQTENIGCKDGSALYGRVEDLGSGDFVKVDCAGCSHTALLAPAFLDRLGLRPRDKTSLASPLAHGRNHKRD